MPHTIWKGRIQFGPVDVPVKLYAAVADIAVHSHLLHDQDRIRLEQRMVCSEDGKVIAPEERVKGYEITTGEFVVLEPNELDFLQPQASRHITVTEFVEAARVDVRCLDRTYYLGPDNDEQLYVNLRAGFQNTGLVGICHWVMRNKSYLGVIQCPRDILTLTTHRFAGEIVEPEAFDLENVDISQKELHIAENLVAELEESFSPQNYRDEYQAKLQKLIDQKAGGHPVELPALKQIPRTADEELLNALEKSMDSLRKHKKQ